MGPPENLWFRFFFRIFFRDILYGRNFQYFKYILCTFFYCKIVSSSRNIHKHCHVIRIRLYLAREELAILGQLRLKYYVIFHKYRLHWLSAIPSVSYNCCYWGGIHSQWSTAPGISHSDHLIICIYLTTICHWSAQYSCSIVGYQVYITLLIYIS